MWPVLALGLALGALLIGALPVVAAIHPGDAVVRTREIELDTSIDGGLGKGTVRCPAGTRVISGGTALHREGQGLTPDFQAKLIGSAPLENGKGWRGAALSFETEAILLLRITVVCLPVSRLDGYRVRTSALGPAPGTTMEGSVGCGTGRRLVTGGVWWAIPGGIYGGENLFRSTPSGDAGRWLATGFTYGTEETMRLVVVCLPAARLGPVAVRTRGYPGGGPGTSDTGGGVACPSGKRALAGGADWRLEGAPTTGSLNSSTVKSSLKGWYAAGDNAAEGIVLRVLVTCVPR